MIAAWGSPTRRCNPHTFSQGVGVNKGYRLMGLGKKGGVHMHGMMRTRWSGWGRKRSK